MGLIRIALVIGLCWLAARLYRQWRRARRERAPAEAAVRKMVKCRTCGVYLPRSDALANGEHLYCSVEHRRAAGDAHGREDGRS